MNVNIEELKRLAEAATPGPWMHIFGDSVVYDRMSDGCRGNSIVAKPFGSTTNNANLSYIAAANPATILALIADFERITKQHGELQSALERMVDLANNDGLWCTYDEVIHAEAVLEQIYKSRQRVVI